MSHIRVDLPNTNNKLVRFGLANVDMFITRVDVRLANIDTNTTHRYNTNTTHLHELSALLQQLKLLKIYFGRHKEKKSPISSFKSFGLFLP